MDITGKRTLRSSNKEQPTKKKAIGERHIELTTTEATSSTSTTKRKAGESELLERNEIENAEPQAARTRANAFDDTSSTSSTTVEEDSSDEYSIAGYSSLEDLEYSSGDEEVSSLFNSLTTISDNQTNPLSLSSTRDTGNPLTLSASPISAQDSRSINHEDPTTPHKEQSEDSIWTGARILFPNLDETIVRSHYESSSSSSSTSSAASASAHASDVAPQTPQPLERAPMWIQTPSSAASTVHPMDITTPGSVLSPVHLMNITTPGSAASTAHLMNITTPGSTTSTVHPMSVESTSSAAYPMSVDRTPGSTTSTVYPMDITTPGGSALSPIHPMNLSHTPHAEAGAGIGHQLPSITVTITGDLGSEFDAAW